MDLSRHADAVERLLKGRGLDGYEILVSLSRDQAIEAKEGKVDAFRVAEPFGVAVRLLAGHGLGFSFSTTMDPAGLSRMVDGALTAARMQTPDPCYTLPSPFAAYPEVPGLYDAELERIDAEAKVARALELERLVLACDPRVRRVRKCSYGESTYQTLVRNSHGLEAGYRGSYVSCSVSAVAEADGDAQTGWDFAVVNSFAGLDIETVARRAGQKATALLGARTVPTMRCPVVLDNRVAAAMVDVLAPSFLAETVQKGKSLFGARMGEPLFSQRVSLRDNGILPGGMGSAPCDGEGVPQQDTELVKEGVLRSFLYDSYWGKRTGCRSTGNAVRGGVKGAPRIGVHNLFVEPGEAAPKTLMQGVDRGLLITDVMGMHTANRISGDFSVGACGFYLEGGEVRYPVKGMAIAGNLLELFKGVEMVGDDLRFFGPCGSPSLAIGSLDVSGT